MLLRIIMAILAFLFALPMRSCTSTNQPYRADYKNLGIPLQSQYDGGRERTAWDIEVFDDKLFVASGDYDKNSGPVSIMHYDFTDQQWYNSGTVPDEQIERFLIINDTLTAPGADPREDWSLGNYYTYSGAEWQTHRIIPGGIHQFDMIEFDGQIFVGIGTSAGQFPVAASSDGGSTYTQVPMYRDGMLLDTMPPLKDDGTLPGVQIRVYDFMTLNGELYALYYYNDGAKSERSIYKYTDQAFWFYDDLSPDLKFKRISYEVFTTKEEFCGKAFLSTGNLYSTEDFIHFNKILLGDSTIVSDMRIIDDKLYICTIKKQSDGQYQTSVWRNSTGRNNDFSELFYFTFPCPAQCFTYHDGVFYFGMGDGLLSDYNESNGTILAISVKSE